MNKKYLKVYSSVFLLFLILGYIFINLDTNKLQLIFFQFINYISLGNFDTTEMIFLAISFSIIYYLTPLPSLPIIMTSGAIFGINGVLVSIIALIISSSILFLIAKYFSSLIIQSENKISKTLSKVSKKLTFTSLLIMSLFLPHFIISVLSGASKIKYRVFFILTLIGNLPYYFAWTIVGAGAKNIVNAYYGESEVSFPSLLYYSAVFIIVLLLFLKYYLNKYEF
jgi:uncharacterized membrane protein YdjX (TVP38/TMEM64 family)